MGSIKSNDYLVGRMEAFEEIDGIIAEFAKRYSTPHDGDSLNARQTRDVCYANCCRIIRERLLAAK